MSDNPFADYDVCYRYANVQDTNYWKCDYGIKAYNEAMNQVFAKGSGYVVVKSRPFYPFFMKKNFLEKEMEKEFDGKNILSSFKK